MRRETIEVYRKRSGLIESLEGRRLFAAPTAVVNPLAQQPADGGTSLEFTVAYTDPDGMNQATFSTPTLPVNGPTFSASASFVELTSITETTLIAKYRLDASFQAEVDDGFYQVSLPLNAVVGDTTGEVMAADVIGGFNVDVGGDGSLGNTPTGTFTVRPDFLAKLLAGGSAPVSLSITNPSTASIGGDVDVKLVASTDSNVDANDPALGRLVGKVLTVAPNRTSRLTLNAALGNDLPAGNYFLAANVTLRDPSTGAVSSVFQVISSTPITIPSFRTALTDADGTIATITLKGGTGGMTLDPVTGLIDIVLDGTTTSSSVKLSAKGGDGGIRLGDVTINGSAKSFDARQADLAGDVNVTGSLTKLTLRDAAEQATITIGASAGPLSIKLADVSELTLSSAAPIKTLDVVSWTGADTTPDVITAPSLDTLKVKGNFAAGLQIAGALKSAKVGGAINVGTWQVGGGAASISVGSISAGWSAMFGGVVSSLSVKGSAAGTIMSAGLTRKKVGGDDQLVVGISN